MDGEIDLELYTIAIIRLNNAFEKLDDEDNAKAMFSESASDLKKFFEDTVNDLNSDEVNYNEYELFLKNGKNSFPEFINILEETLDKTNDDNMKDSLKSLINTFTNLSKIAEGMIKWTVTWNR